MEILGHTVSGKLIIAVSQEEWNSLQSGVKPSDDIDWNRVTKRDEEFPETQVGQILESKFKKCAVKTWIKRAHGRGEIDGTIDSTLKWLDEHYILRNVSLKTRKLLVDTLREIQATNARPSHP